MIRSKWYLVLISGSLIFPLSCRQLPKSMLTLKAKPSSDAIASYRHENADKVYFDYSDPQILLAQKYYTRSIATVAYLYQLPVFLHLQQMSEFINERLSRHQDQAPFGGWLNMRQLPDDTTTTRLASADTLDSSAFLLLDRHGPIILSVPEITDRYYAVALTDAYCNNFAYIGPSHTGVAAGHYLIVPPGWQGSMPSDITKVFKAPTATISLQQRLRVYPDDDIVRLQRIQDQFHITVLGTPEGGSASNIDYTKLRHGGVNEQSDALRFFKLTSQYMLDNPPPLEDQTLTEMFRSAGLGPGGTLPLDPIMQRAIIDGSHDAKRMIDAKTVAGPYRSGWRIPDSNVGRAGPFMLSRSVFLTTQKMGDVPEEVTTYFGKYDIDNDLLSGGNNYRLQFSQKEQPPTRAKGFWSLTMYDQEGLLVSNSLGRFVIRADTPGLVVDDKGTITICLGQEKAKSCPESNWLPAPDGEFFVALRVYYPDTSHKTNEWFPPAMERVGP